MYGCNFRLRGFDRIAERHRIEVLHLLMEALIAADLAWLLAHPGAPSLYEARVMYEQEPAGGRPAWAQSMDDWRDIAECLELGCGQCPDLCAWRIAELRLRGESGARPHFKLWEGPRVGGGTKAVYHVQVMRGDERIEDPSALLGMP